MKIAFILYSTVLLSLATWWFVEQHVESAILGGFSHKGQLEGAVFVGVLLVVVCLQAVCAIGARKPSGWALRGAIGCLAAQVVLAAYYGLKWLPLDAFGGHIIATVTVLGFGAFLAVTLAFLKWSLDCLRAVNAAQMPVPDELGQDEETPG